MLLPDSAVRHPAAHRSPNGSSVASGTDADVNLLRIPGGVQLHCAHHAAADGEPRSAGQPPRARSAGSATDDIRVGSRQPLLGGSIGGPCILQRSNGTPRATATRTARHPSAGAAAPRPDARSSANNPRRSGLADDSAARANSLGVPAKARRRGAQPTAVIGITSHHGRGGNKSASENNIGILVEGSLVRATAVVPTLRQAGGTAAAAEHEVVGMLASAHASVVAPNIHRFGVREPTP